MTGAGEAPTVSGAAEPLPTAARRRGEDGFALFLNLFREANSAFNAFDEDGDGTITLAECAQTLRELGHSPDESELQALIGAR